MCQCHCILFKSVADLMGGACPYGPKFSQFRAVFWKIWQNHMLAPLGGLSPPPGTAPASNILFKFYNQNLQNNLFIFHLDLF